MKGQAKIAAEMARRLGEEVAPSSVAYWKSRGAPIDSLYRTDIDKLVEWYRLWIRRNDAKHSPDLAEARVKLQLLQLQEKLRREKRENDRAEAQLVAAADVQAELVAQAQIIRQALDRLPDLIADQWQQVVDRQTLRVIAGEAVRDIYGQLSADSAASDGQSDMAVDP